MTLPTILTDITQLEGKKIKSIDIYDVIDTRTVYVTEDNCILVESQYPSSAAGVDYIAREYSTTLLEIYEELDSYLTDEGIVSQDDFNELEEEWNLKQEAEDEKRKESQRKLRYDNYLKLKEEFEVSYKLD